MKKSLTRNFSVYMLKNMVSIIVPLITIPYVSRILGPSGLGDVQYTQSWVSYFSLIAGLGISSYAVREGAQRRDEPQKLGEFSVEIVTISFLATIVAYLSFAIFLCFFKTTGAQPSLFLVFSLLIGATGLNTEWICTVFEDYDYISKRSIAFQLLSVVLLFVLVKKSGDMVAYAVVLTMPTVATCLLNWIYGIKKIRWKYNVQTFSIKKHIKPIVYIFGVGVASTIYTSLDSTMLGYILDSEAVGIYTVASRLTKSVLSLINASCVVFLPRLSYYAGKDRKEFHALSSKVINALLTVTVPCAVGMFILAEEAIAFFSGNGFEAAVVPMRILTLNLFFSALDGFLAWQILVPLNREKNLLAATILGMITDAVLNAFLIPLNGVAGAAYATLIAEVCVCVVNVASCYNLVPFRAIIKNIVQCILAVLPFGGVYSICVIAGVAGMARVFIMVICCLLIYIFILLLMCNKTCMDLLKVMKNTIAKSKFFK